MRREQALYLPRERQCPKFSGSRTAGTLSIEEWTEEAQSCIRSRYMSDLEKAMFLYDHLEGEARSEIKYRPVTVRENPTEMISVLKEVYGCSKSYVYWQQRFFDRKQKETESLFEFSHALMDLMAKVKQSKQDSIANADMVLRDQFCENVRDPMLRRELKRMVRANGGSSLLDVRWEATRWVEEGQTSRDRTHSAPGRRSEAPCMSQCEATAAQPSEMAELKEIVLKQQAQLDMLVQHLGQPIGKSRAPQPYREGRFKRAPDGQPICIQCEQPGHIARYCQSAPLSRNRRPAPRPFPDSTEQSVPLGHSSSSQPENLKNRLASVTERCQALEKRVPTAQAPPGDVAVIQDQLRDALDKNQHWLVYDQQREAYSQGLLARTQELEQQVNQTTHQHNKEGNSEVSKTSTATQQEQQIKKLQEQQTKQLQEARRVAELLREKVSRAERELEELRQRAGRAQTEAQVERQSSQLAGREALEQRERVTKAEREADSLREKVIRVQEEACRLRGRYEEKQQELENTDALLEEERKRASELLLQVNLLQKSMLNHHDEQKRVSILQQQVQLSVRDFETEKLNRQELQNQLHCMLKELRKAREQISRLEATKHQPRFPEPSSYTRRLTLEDPGPISPSKVLDESFLEWRPKPCGAQPDRQQVSIPTPTGSLNPFPPGMKRGHCQRAQT